MCGDGAWDRWRGGEASTPGCDGPRCQPANLAMHRLFENACDFLRKRSMFCRSATAKDSSNDGHIRPDNTPYDSPFRASLSDGDY